MVGRGGGVVSAPDFGHRMGVGGVIRPILGQIPTGSTHRLANIGLVHNKKEIIQRCLINLLHKQQHENLPVIV